MGRIGVFGGAFNPIHNGHLFIAKESMEVFHLDYVIFVPTGNPVFEKSDLLDKDARLRLVELATKDEPRFTVSKFETERDAPSYYIDTLKNLLNGINDEIYSILGEDTFRYFHRWKENENIIKLTNMIIAERYEDSFASTKEYILTKYKNYTEKIKLLLHPFYRVSSTIIRERIKEGQHIDYLVPWKVKEEIINNHYYRA